MRLLFRALFLCVCVCVAGTLPIQAQTSGGAIPDYKRQFNFFITPGAVSGVEIGQNVKVPAFGSFLIGGSGERFFLDGLAIGIEMAVRVGPSKSKPIDLTYRDLSGNEKTESRRASGVGGLASLNLAYHFKKASPNGGFMPFVTVGKSLAGRSELAGSTNYGAGFTRWKNRHWGWRLEYRKYIIDEGAFNSKFRSVRIGLSLR